MPEALHGAALASLLSGDRARALTFAKQSVESQGSSAAAVRLYALLLTLAGNYEESHRQLKEAWRREPGNAELLFDLSEIRRLDGKRSQALEYLDLAVELDPENPLYHNALARLYRELKREDLAVQESERGASLMRAFDVYTESLRIAAGGDLQSAIRTLRPVVTADPLFLTGKMFLADLWSRQGDTRKAGELYQQVLQADPNRVDAREKSAWIKTQLGDPASALELLRAQNRPGRQRVPQAEDKTGTLQQNALLTDAHWLLREGKWAEALDRLQQVELRNPLNPQLLKLISSCLRELGRDDEALKYLDRAQKIQPDDAEIKTIRIEIQRQQAYRLLDAKKWQAAGVAFDWLSKADGPLPEYLLNLGYCRESLGDLAGASAFYEKGLRKDPGAHWARKNLAACLLRLLRYRQAVGHWENVVRTEKTQANLLQLGICYANLERTPEAERVLQEALALQPGSGEILVQPRDRAAAAEEGGTGLGGHQAGSAGRLPAGLGSSGQGATRQKAGLTRTTNPCPRISRICADNHG